MDHAVIGGIHDCIYSIVQVWSIPLSIIIEADFLGSGGLLGLCAAILDPIIFALVLALAAFCAIGFLITIAWSVAQSVLYRHSEQLRDAWKRIMKRTPFKEVIQIVRGIFPLGASRVRYGIYIVDVMGRLKRSVQRYLHPRWNRSTMLPSSHWDALRTWSLGLDSSRRDDLGLEAVQVDERDVGDQLAEAIQVEDNVKNPADFWQLPPNAEGVLLNVIRADAHVRAIR